MDNNEKAKRMITMLEDCEKEGKFLCENYDDGTMIDVHDMYKAILSGDFSAKTFDLIDEYQKAGKCRGKHNDLTEEAYSAIRVSASNKAVSQYIKLDSSLKLLPITYRKDFVQKEVYYTLEVWKKRFNDYLHEDKPDIAYVETFTPNDLFIKSLVQKLDINDYGKYVDFKSEGKAGVELPKFDEFTDYIALIQYYSYLIYLSKESNLEGEINYKKQNQLQTKLTDQQRSKLCNLLINGGFTPASTDIDGFIWAFGGKNDNYTSFSTEWLEPNAKNLAVYLIDKLCYDPTSSINFWAIGERIFSNVKGMRSQKQIYLGNGKKDKPNDPARGKPRGYNLIDEIIAEAKK